MSLSSSVLCQVNEIEIWLLRQFIKILLTSSQDFYSYLVFLIHIFLKRFKEILKPTHQVQNLYMHEQVRVDKPFLPGLNCDAMYHSIGK